MKAQTITKAVIAVSFLIPIASGCTSSDEKVATAVALTVEAQRAPHVTSPSATRASPATPVQTTAPTPAEPSIVWSAQVVGHLSYPGPGGFWSSFALHDTQVFVGTPGGRIEAHELATGEIIWVSETNGIILGADSENVYLFPSTKRIDALSIETGEQMWYTLLEIPDASIAGKFVIADSTIHVPFISRNSAPFFVTLEKATGKLLWTRPGAPFEYRNGVLLTSDGGSLLGLSAATGSPIWQITSDQIAFTSEPSSGLQIPFIDCGATLVYFVRGADRPQVHIAALNPSSGTPLWEANAIGSVDCFPYTWSLAYVEALYDNIYLSSDRLMGINPATGEIRWTGDKRLDESDYVFQGEAERLVVYSHQGFGITQAYDVNTHTLIWENPNVALHSFYGHSDGALVGEIEPQDLGKTHIYYGLDALTGAEMWKREVQSNRVRAHRPKLVLGLFVIGNRGQVLLLDPRTGAELATFSIPGTPAEYLPAGNDHIVVVSNISDELRSVSMIRP